MTNFAAIVIWFAAFAVAVVLLWRRLVEWIDLTVCSGALSTVLGSAV